MVKVQKGEKVALFFESNIDIGGTPTITYKILSLSGSILASGNGTLINKTIRTDVIDFSTFDTGIYEAQIILNDGTEIRIISEFIEVI